MDTLEKEYTLQREEKSENDTAGPAVLVPKLLVFGLFPLLPINPKDLPTQSKRMNAIHTARNEMDQLIAKDRVRTALSRNLPAATDTEIRILDQIIVFREKPDNKRTGPFDVVDVDGKAVHVQIGGRIVQISIDKVSKYQIDGGDGQVNIVGWE